MSIFIATLAFPSAALLASAKLGILAASLTAGAAGWAVLRWAGGTGVAKAPDAR
jgi:NhaA family Na+:H+ antiporter